MENIALRSNENILVTMTNKKKRQVYKSRAEKRLGETRINNQGELMFIVEYVNNKNITVQFKLTGELVKCKHGDFKRGQVKSHFTPSIYGVGIVGLEKTVGDSGKHLKSYEHWRNMLTRCCSEKFKQKHKTYEYVGCCDEWKYYSNF